MLMKKLFTYLMLMVGMLLPMAANAADLKADLTIYYDVSDFGDFSGKKLQAMIGHGSYSTTYEMKAVEGYDNLYSLNIGQVNSGNAWGGATQLGFMAADAIWGGESNGSSSQPKERIKWAPMYTGIYNISSTLSGNVLFTGKTSLTITKNYVLPAKAPVIKVGAAPEFATTTVGETSSATVTYTLENADKAEATIEGEGFSIAEQSVGSVTITFAPEAEGDYTGTLTITSGEVKETVALAAKAVAAEAPKVPEFLNVTTPVFAEIIEGEVTTAEVTYELVNATEATASVDGEFFSIKEQELGTVIIEFASEEAGVFEGTLTLTSGETVKEITFTATAKKAPVVITISFVNPDWTEAAFYAWGADGLPSTWPGALMTKGENGKFTYDLTLPESGTYNFIINNNDKGTQSVDMTGVTESTCYNLGAKSDGKYNLVVAENCDYTPAPEPEPIDPYAAIRGLGEGTEEEAWSESKQIKLAINEDATEEEWFIKDLVIAEGKAFKVVYVNAKSETAWYGAGAVEANEDLGKFGEGEDNITLAAGKYDIYFKVATGTMWIAPVKAVEPEPEPADPVINVIVADFTNNTTEVGDRADAAIVYSLENAESATVTIEGEYVTFEQTDVEEGYMIGIFFTPEQVGEFPGKVIITAGEVTEEVEFTFIATEPEEDDDDEEEAELEFALVGRLNGSDDEILAFEDGYKFTKESEFVYTVNVTFTGAAVSGDNNVQKVKLVDAEGNIWARSKNNSKTIYTSDTQGKQITSTMSKGDTESSTYLVTEVGVEYKITFTLETETNGQITFEKVESSDEGGEEGDDEGEEPSNEITFTVVVPEGTVECWIAGTGTPAWTFIQMEAVEGEANMFTLTTTKDILDGVEWKYSSGNDWQYCEKIDGGGNRTEAGNPDVVTAWEKLYDPDFQPIDPYYAIRGLNGDASWTGAGDIKLVYDETENQWAGLGFTVAEGESFKVIYIDENGDIPEGAYYAGFEEGCNVGQTFDKENGNIVLPAGKYNLYFKPATGLMWISIVEDTSTDAEEAIAELIYAIDGTIYAPAPFAIIDLAGKDVTKANGALEGTYIVQTQNSVTKVLVK